MVSDQPSSLAGTVTGLLDRVRAGEQGATDDLFAVVYDELRQIARMTVARAGAGHKRGLEGTELVHIACARLLVKCGFNAENRKHFYFLFGRAMRDVLVEDARAATALRRGGGRKRVPLGEVGVERARAGRDAGELGAALGTLSRVDPLAAQVVELRYLSGLTIERTAEMLGCSVATVRRNCEYGRAWLAERLSMRE